MVWKNETAAVVISRTELRMKLIFSLKIQDERDPLVERLKPHFNKQQPEIIYGKRKPAARTVALIDILSKRMTTELFSEFLDALGDYEICNKNDLKMQILQAYENGGGYLTTEMEQWINGDFTVTDTIVPADNSNDEIDNAERIVLENFQPTQKSGFNAVEFGGPPKGEELSKEVSNTYHLHLESPIRCFNGDRFSFGKPMILATCDDDVVTGIPNESTNPQLTLYSFDEQTIKKHPLHSHSGSILHCFAVGNGTYGLISSKDSQDPSSAAVQVSLWPNPKSANVQLVLKDIHCTLEEIEKLSACVITSEEKALLLIFSQDSCQGRLYFISDDEIKVANSMEVDIEKITGMRSINFNSKHYCVFWGGQQWRILEIDVDTAHLEEKFLDEVDSEIWCCEFIVFENTLLLAVSYADSEGSHSIDLWRMDKETNALTKCSKNTLHKLKISDGTKLDMFADQVSRQLIVSGDDQYLRMIYNPEDMTLTEKQCVNVKVNDSLSLSSQCKLLKSDDECMVYFVRTSNKTVSITPIPFV